MNRSITKSQKPKAKSQRVLVFGTFDKLHPGHQFLLSEASKRGQLYVVIARDVTVERIKGRLPEQSQEERMACVQRQVPSAIVLLGDGSDYLAPVRTIAPERILLGYDQKLPPGVTPENLGVPVERMGALKPEAYKSSIRRKHRNDGRSSSCT